jgi:hypothetical protein
MMFGDTGGRVGVSDGGGASVKDVAVTVGVFGVAVDVGVFVTTEGVFVFVMVTMIGVTVKMEGVIVGGGAGNVGTVYDQPSQLESKGIMRNMSGIYFFIEMCSSC